MVTRSPLRAWVWRAVAPEPVGLAVRAGAVVALAHGVLEVLPGVVDLAADAVMGIHGVGLVLAGRVLSGAAAQLIARVAVVAAVVVAPAGLQVGLGVLELLAAVAVVLAGLPAVAVAALVLLPRPVLAITGLPVCAVSVTVLLEPPRAGAARVALNLP